MEVPREAGVGGQEVPPLGQSDFSLLWSYYLPKTATAAMHSLSRGQGRARCPHRAGPPLARVPRRAGDSPARPTWQTIPTGRARCPHHARPTPHARHGGLGTARPTIQLALRREAVDALGSTRYEAF